MSDKLDRLAALCAKKDLTDAEKAEVFSLAKELGYSGPFTIESIRSWVEDELRKRHQEDDDDDYRPPSPKM